ncbi:MAG: MalM family protein [Sulfuricella sp.]|nr:MalM family protein [Sulfuricella sp.]
MRKTVLYLITVLLIQGCASAPTNESVRSLSVCCKSFSEIPYVQLGLEEKQSVRISEDSPVFEFSEGKSRFTAFEFKPSERVKAVDIDIAVSSIYLPSATIFLPSFVFLNSDKQPTRTVSEIQVQQLHDFWAGEYFFTRVEVMPGERYLVVYTDAKSLGQTIPLVKGGAGNSFLAGKTPIYVPGGGGVTHQLPRDAIGVISLKAKK